MTLKDIEVSESFTNETEGYTFDNSEWYEPYTDDLGQLFRSYRSEFGSCRSRVYVDTDDGIKPVGWYFEKRMKYEDSNETYLRGVWVQYRFPRRECEEAVSKAFVASLA